MTATEIKFKSSGTRPVEIYSLSPVVKASVVIPHFYSARESNMEALLTAIAAQSLKEIEIILIHDISPQGKAINMGVRQAKGEHLIIMDDDSRMGHERVFENLINLLKANPDVGMAGASVILPETGNKFQIMASKQFPRYKMPIVDQMLESDFPGHPCAAFPKKVFIEAGLEREDIYRGLDPDLRERIRKTGHKVVLAPQTWIYHPMPDSFSKFVWTFFRNGYGSAYLFSVHPELNYDTDESLESKTFVAKRPFLYRLLRYPVRLLQSLVTFQWLRFTGYSVYVLGYLAGLIDVWVLRKRIST
jgi:GT2 family glycosyltransferase